MTDQGLLFSLTAYPSPDNFVFFHLGNVTSNHGSEVPSSRFFSLCRQNAVTLSMVNCTITPVDVPKALLGFYRATVSNELGSVNITFSIESEGIKLTFIVLLTQTGNFGRSVTEQIKHINSSNVTRTHVSP